MLLGFCCLEFYVNHFYSPLNDHRLHLNWVGWIALLLSSLTFVVVSGYLSYRVAPTRVVRIGAAVLIAASVAGRAMMTTANVHDWTFMFLLIPVVSLACGCLLFVVGAVRLLRNKFRRPPSES